MPIHIPWLRRKAKPNSAATSEAEARTQVKRSPLDQAMNIVLPVGVIALFLWWFSTIPPAGEPPTLAANWTPGCPEWAIPWQAPPPNLPGDKIRLITRDFGANRWHWVIRSSKGWELRTVRISDGEVMAAIAGGLGQLDTTRHLAEFDRGSDAFPEVTLRDYDSLQQVGLQRFRSTELPVVAGFTAFQSLIEMPDSSWAGILIYLPQSKVDNNQQVFAGRRNATAHVYWFHATSDGTITDYRRLPHASSTWRPVPPDAPTTLLGWTFEGPKLVPGVALDLATGQDVESPDAEATAEKATPRPHRSLLDRRLSAIPLRRTAFHWSRNETLAPPGIEAEMSILHPFQPRYPAPNEPWHRFVRYEAASLRYQSWRLTHRPRELLDAATQSVTVDGVTLHPGLESDAGSIAITGELRDTVDYEVRHAYLNAYSMESPATTYGTETRYGCELMLNHRNCEIGLRTLPGGAYLILQVLREAPKLMGEPDGMLRIGTLRRDGARVEWYGWVSLETLDPGLQVLIDPVTMQVEVAEGRLFLALSADGQQIRLQQRFPRTVAWITLPLPPELADLPEGPLS